MFKKCAIFTRCITSIDGTTTDDAEVLGLNIPMWNLIECSSNYCKTTESLWFYSKDEASDVNNNISNTDYFNSLN